MDRLGEAGATWFTPIRVILASPERDAEGIVARPGGEGRLLWREDKFDGIRGVELTRDLSQKGTIKQVDCAPSGPTGQDTIAQAEGSLRRLQGWETEAPGVLAVGAG